MNIDDETLDLYAGDRISDELDLQRIEEHLLVCAICQDRLSAEDQFVKTFRPALEGFGWEYVHQTDDGEVRMSVQHAKDGKYIARIIGAQLDCGTCRESSAAAQTWCEESFRQMFPEHQCGTECRMG